MTALLLTGAVTAWSGPDGHRSNPPSQHAAASPPATATETRDEAPGSEPAARRAVPAGTVGVPIRLAEPAALEMVAAGDRVDLVAVGLTGGGPTGGPADGPTEGRATVVARGARVLRVTAATDPAGGGVLLALRPAEAERVVEAPQQARFAVLLRPDD